MKEAYGPAFFFEDDVIEFPGWWCGSVFGQVPRRFGLLGFGSKSPGGP